MSAILAQAFLHTLARNRKISELIVNCIEDQNDLDRRVCFGDNNVGGVEGNNLLRVIVVKQRKVLWTKTGDRLASCIGHNDIQVNPPHRSDGCWRNNRLGTER